MARGRSALGEDGQLMRASQDFQFPFGDRYEHLRSELNVTNELHQNNIQTVFITMSTQQLDISIF